MESVLKVELYRAGITQQQIADRLNIRVQAVNAKVNGKSKVTTDEAFVIQDMITEKTHKEISLRDLFPISNS